MKAMTLAIPIDQPIRSKHGPVYVRIVHDVWAIKAPEPIGVVAAIAIRPPPKRRSVPSVSIASRNRYGLTR